MEQDSRRTFSFGGAVHSGKYRRKAYVSGDSNIVDTSQRRTFSFGAAYNKHPRRLQRQMTRSGDSGISATSYSRSMSRMFNRAFSTTLTLNSVEGSSSTILLEDWRPIFDKFDREVDGKQVRQTIHTVKISLSSHV